MDCKASNTTNHSYLWLQPCSSAEAHHPDRQKKKSYIQLRHIAKMQKGPYQDAELRLDSLPQKPEPAVSPPTALQHSNTEPSPVPPVNINIMTDAEPAISSAFKALEFWRYKDSSKDTTFTGMIPSAGINARVASAPAITLDGEAPIAGLRLIVGQSVSGDSSLFKDSDYESLTGGDEKLAALLVSVATKQKRVMTRLVTGNLDTSKQYLLLIPSPLVISFLDLSHPTRAAHC